TKASGGFVGRMLDQARNENLASAPITHLVSLFVFRFELRPFRPILLWSVVAWRSPSSIGVAAFHSGLTKRVILADRAVRLHPFSQRRQRRDLASERTSQRIS